MNRINLLKREFLPTTLFVVLICAYLVLNEIFKYGATKYIIYAIPFVYLTVFRFSKGADAFHVRNTWFLASYACIFAISVIFNIDYGDYWIRDGIVLTSALLAFCFGFNSRAEHLKILLFGYLLASILLYAMGNKNFSGGISVQESKGLLETSYAFPIGLIALYFIFAKDWKWVAISIFIVILEFKRISILAMVPCVLACLAFRFENKFSSFSERLMGIAGFGVISLIGLYFDTIVVAVANYFEIRTNIDVLTLGRYTFDSILSKKIEFADISHKLIGFGPGSSQHNLEIYGFKIAPHNDYLKILFEYGWIGYFVIYAIFCSYLVRTRFGIVLLTYQALIFTTDNTLIYLWHLLTLPVVLCAMPIVRINKDARTSYAARRAQRLSVR